MSNSNPNPFARYAYRTRDQYLNEPPEDYAASNNLQTLTGGDLQAYINNIKVGNLESCTWSISVEVVGNYVMGRRDAVTYTTGKRVVVGSVVFSQYDRHALLEGVFNLRKKGIRNQGDLWDYISKTDGTSNAARELARENYTTTMPLGVGSNVNTSSSYAQLEPQAGNSASYTSNPQMRGLSSSAFDVQLQQQLRDTARLVGSNRISYSDQLPPFDLTLTGVTKNGTAARCSIFGMQITQETAGFSQNDLGNSVGMSFVALGLEPWRPVEFNASTNSQP